MSVFGVKEEGADSVRRKLGRMADRLEAEVDTTTRKFADQFMENVQLNVGLGIPGMPQPRTRQYENSWFVVKMSDGTYQLATVAPQVWRLEFGFVGVDSSGRHYQQAALPHIEPARLQTLKDVRPMYVKMLRRISR